MKKLDAAATIQDEVLAALFEVEDKVKEWDRQTNNVKAFKSAIYLHGMDIQEERCVWCTLQMGPKGRRSVHRDHIAPKKLHPEWTFQPLNIALACEYCNGFSVKVDLETVEASAANYLDVKFYLVHPYLDDPEQHISFAYGADGERGVLISSETDKGRWTIKNLKLDSPGMTVERAKDAAYARISNTLPQYYKNMMDAAMESLSS